MKHLIPLYIIPYLFLIEIISAQNNIQAEVNSLQKLKNISYERDLDLRGQIAKSRRKAYKLSVERDKAYNQLVNAYQNNLSQDEKAALKKIQTTSQAKMDSIYRIAIPKLEEQRKQRRQDFIKVNNELSQLIIKRNKALASDSSKTNLNTKSHAVWTWDKRRGDVFTSNVSLYPKGEDRYESVGFKLGCPAFGNKSNLTPWMYVSLANENQSNMSFGEYYWGDKGGKVNQDYPSWYRWISVTTDDHKFNFGSTGAATGTFMIGGRGNDFINMLLNDPDDKVQFYIHLFVYAEGGPRVFAIETTGFKAAYALFKENCK